MAYFRKGVASFELEEYETALSAFKNGKAQFDKEGKPENSSRPYSRWIRKCETELDDDSEDEIKVESTANGGGGGGGGGNSTKAAASEEPQPPIPQPKPSLKYQFYQSADWVTVSLMEKKLQEPELQVSIEEFTLSVTVTREGQEVQETPNFKRWTSTPSFLFCLSLSESFEFDNIFLSLQLIKIIC